MSTTKPKRLGRPPIPSDQHARVRTIRLSDAHWTELQARGGVPALRVWLDKPAKRKAPAEA